MQQAFGGVASVLLGANILTAELIENHLCLFIIEAALAGKWITLPADEVRTEIFPGHLGHISVWNWFNKTLPKLFLAEISEWKSKLLDVESNKAVSTAETAIQHPLPATTGERRAWVDRFIVAVLDTTGRKITRKDIWTVAGYSEATDFERFQRNDKRTSKSALANFCRVLGMEPANFFRMLNKRNAESNFTRLCPLYPPLPFLLPALREAAYPDAISLSLGTWVDFAQLIKIYRAAPEGERRYSPAEVVSTEVVPVIGEPDPRKICTSHVERQNLTM